MSGDNKCLLQNENGPFGRIASLKNGPFFFPSLKCGNGSLYRWDPEKSTRIKWETTYASELQSRGLTQDFTGLSTLLLGQAQPKQLQSYDDEEPLGFWWGSKVTDDGTFTELDSVASANANTEMPRSYYEGANAHGAYYNYYAATAETSKYATTISPTDSICPFGWKMPKSDSEQIDSWDYLITTTYGYNTGNISEQIRKMPLSLYMSGYIAPTSGWPSSTESHGYYWTSEVPSSNTRVTIAYELDFTTTLIDTLNTGQRARGYNIRCLMHGSQQ